MVSKVSKAAVKRGEIGFKQTEGLDAAIYYLPKEETVTGVEDVLRSTFPKVEIVTIVLFSTFTVWATVVFLVRKFCTGVEDVLKSAFPTVEIAMIVVFCTFIVWDTVVFLVSLTLLH